MRVLIFGGLGFIGSNLAKRLSEKGYEVYVAHRGFSGGYREKLASIVSRYASLTMYSDPRDPILSIKPNIIYNLVGRYFGSEREIIDANLVFVERLSKALEGYSDYKLIHISAATVVGPKGDVIYEEEKHLVGIEPRGVFDESKAEAERIIASRIKSWVIVRPVLVYGAYNAHPEWVTLVGIVRRGIAPLIRARVSAIEVGELSEILVRALELDREYFFATECEPYWLSDFVEAISQVYGARSIKIPVPLWLTRITAPRDLRKHLPYLNKVFSCDKMVRLTGYRPRRMLRRGVEEMVKWILETGGESMA
ncbi:NAD-dependent epimerase/dehydratase [Desulfurococcaceae archaeon AG1]|jgi:nucleoside-diphosphate-sugar epimerase|nr:MAG: NAD-dependent epimerase [Desulfurococcaceae archaeon]GAY25087.1 NAD-dependent epimerase/dehydratase [Desulfurococcaceae archaeon AG1]